MTDLDKDFKDIVKQINVYLKEAAAQLKQANSLREQAGLSSLILSNYVSDEIDSSIRNTLDEDETGKYDNEDVYENLVQERYDAIEAKYEAIDVADLEAELED